MWKYAFSRAVALLMFMMKPSCWFLVACQGRKTGPYYPTESEIPAGLSVGGWLDVVCNSPHGDFRETA